MKIILASATPRRKELLKRLYSDFEVVATDVDETLPEDIGADFAPIYLAAIKAESLSGLYPEDLVITADTVVIHNGEIFGKPKDEADARRMLTALSGETHKVITGCCLTYGDTTCTFSSESYVTFYPLSEKEIEEYLATNEPYGKAGAYAIQGQGCLLVERIEGDYNNIVGLPVSQLKREIEDLLA